VSLAPLIADILGGDPALSDVTVRCAPDLCAWADPHRVEQIVVNYLSNALKYGAAPIVVDVVADMGWTELRVHDTGPGVPAEQLSSLFGRFTPGTRTVHRSTGLGLSIARHLARALDGDVWYERSETGGACFAVRLPAANA
jgi:signal transduction histidine kinase